MKTLADYLQECITLQEDDFCQQHRCAFLLHSAIADGSLKHVDATRVPTLDRLEVEGRRAPHLGSSPFEWFQVFELPFQGSGSARLSIGCSRTCDVVLDDASVSRRHAWMIATDYGCYVQDADSSAGTAVNGKVLKKDEAAKLKAGDRVSFGSVDLVYLPASSFYSFVRTMARP
jgi:hypothetical protein